MVNPSITGSYEAELGTNVRQKSLDILPHKLIFFIETKYKAQLSLSFSFDAVEFVQQTLTLWRLSY